MRIRFQPHPPNNLSVPALLAVLVFPLLCVAEPQSPFSFDGALSLYNDVKTASQLSKYLETASPDNQKDFRYVLFKIRGYYANYKFSEGDSLFEEGLTGAKKASLSAEDLKKIETDLKNERDYWQGRYTKERLVGHPGGTPESNKEKPEILPEILPDFVDPKVPYFEHTGSGGGFYILQLAKPTPIANEEQKSLAKPTPIANEEIKSLLKPDSDG